MLALGVACNARPRSQQAESAIQQPVQVPLSVSVVPTKSFEEPYGRGISMAKKSPGDFYVILTNISKDPQAAFEDWNSWGCQAVSFRIETPDGHKFTVSRKPQLFTKNYPSTFGIPPGEHMVYPISLDDEWETTPAIPMTVETPITLTAIYEVRPTPESAKEKVWTGHLESGAYHFKLRQW